MTDTVGTLPLGTCSAIALDPLLQVLNTPIVEKRVKERLTGGMITYIYI